ncbi:hypothetical protein ACFWXE_23850 [[Kitasatospora] papulosa]|uniref:hypothetical protein n=1 Tax=[Kitasatospora] papulosa TaxID=1464011 RepID=UPI0036A4A738
MFAGLGLDPAGPPAQLGHDRVDALLIAGVVPGEHATAAVELYGGEGDFSRWIDTFHAENADAAARAARAQIEGGGPPTRQMLLIYISVCTVMHVGPPSIQAVRPGRLQPTTPRRSLMAGVEDTLSEMIRESPCSALNRTQALHHVLVVLGAGYEWRDGEVVRRHGRDGRDCRSTHEQFKLPADHVALLREHGRAVEQQYVDGTCPAEHLRTHAAELARTPGPLGQDPYPASPGAPLFNVPADAAADWVDAAREIAAVVVPSGRRRPTTR